MSDLLEQALCADNLHQAWEEIEENQGIPGVDGVSIRVWRRNWEERLIELARSVRANRYKPKRLRLRRIPKKDRRQFRTLRIPSMADRILQRAVLQVLHPVFERRFLDCSYGYRPGRGLAEAVQRIIVLRENDYRWLLDADVDAFFDNVDHELLLRFLHQDLPDESLLPLIVRWLELGRNDPKPSVGIPLGSPLSPLWANVFLHRLDGAVTANGHDLVRYADDFIVFASTQREAGEIRAEVGETLSALRLRYEPAKTRLACFEMGFDFLGVHFERDTYCYTYMEKEIEVRGEQVDWLFTRYGPEYA
jgi:CRISPR-associated protein Cas1